MKFTEALREMKEGKKVKLPSWGGYWYWDKEKQTVMIQCRPQDSDQGELLDIRETQRVEYTLSNVAFLMRISISEYPAYRHPPLSKADPRFHLISEGSRKHLVIATSPMS